MMTRRAPVLVSYSCAMLAAACGGAGGTAQTLGVVDLEVALRQTSDGQRAHAELQRTFVARQQELDMRGARLQQQQALIEQGPIGQALGPQGDPCAAIVELVRERESLRRDFELYQQQLQAAEQAAVQRIAERLRQIAQRIADEQGIVVVFSREGYVAPGVRRVELTDEVVRRYEATYTMP